MENQNFIQTKKRGHTFSSFTVLTIKIPLLFFYFVIKNFTSDRYHSPSSSRFMYWARGMSNNLLKKCWYCLLMKIERRLALSLMEKAVRANNESFGTNKHHQKLFSENRRKNGHRNSSSFRLFLLCLNGLLWDGLTYMEG